MELKIDKTTKILLALIAFSLILNAVNNLITTAYADTAWVKNSPDTRVYIECVKGCGST